MAIKAYGHGQGQEPSVLTHALGRRAYRYKRVRISCHLLQQFITQDSRGEDVPWGSRCIEGLPEDARLVHSDVEWAGTSPMLCMVFEHPDWPEIPEGEQVPGFAPVFHRYPKDTGEQTETAADAD